MVLIVPYAAGAVISRESKGELVVRSTAVLRGTEFCFSQWRRAVRASKLLAPVAKEVTTSQPQDALPCLCRLPDLPGEITIVARVPRGSERDQRAKAFVLRPERRS